MKKHLMIFILLVYSLMLTRSFAWAGTLTVESGKIHGKIIDPSTRKPVKESFFIRVFVFKDNEKRVVITPMKILKGKFANDPDSSLKTDENGQFSAEFPEGAYNISIAPVNKASIYCEEPFFENYREKYSGEFDKKIFVEKGKITWLIRRATLGGNVKVLLVDPDGNPVDPQTDFWNQPSIKISIGSRLVAGSVSELMTSELVLPTLFPETYQLNADICGFGTTSIKMFDVVVKAGEITAVRLTLKPKDGTGVEGYVFDKNGIPVQSAEIGFAPTNPTDTLFIKIETNATGYYRLNGVPEGRYEVILAGNRLRLESPVYIEVKKNVLLRLDLKSKFSLN